MSVNSSKKRSQVSDSSISPMEKKEQDMLYSAIQGFVGHAWNGSDLYPDPCGWTPIQGVSCDLFNGLWYVTTMSIGPILDNSLQCAQNATFTDHLFKLKHLRSLSFFNCFFSNTTMPSSIWQELSNSLESLEFRSNPGLVGTIPSSIGYLKELRSLVLLENGLTGQLPVELGNLVNLKRLVLSGNKFTGRIPATYGGLSGLLILDASGNSLSGSLPSTIGDLTSLLKIDLSKNKIQGKIPKEIGRLKNLTLLDLRGNNFSGGLIHELQELVSLKEMILSDNANMGGDLMGIDWKNLESLEIVDLSGIGLTGAIPQSLSKMASLRYLGLNDNKLSGRVCSSLENLQNLGALYLNGNNFTGNLEFSRKFYKKVGKRFRAWKNPNLCYKMVLGPSGLMSGSQFLPFGVKHCLQVSVEGSNSKKIEGNYNQDSKVEASLGHSRFTSCGYLLATVVQVIAFSLDLFKF